MPLLCSGLRRCRAQLTRHFLQVQGFFKRLSAKAGTALNCDRPGQFKGSAAIVEKLRTLPFQQVKHQVVTLDTQPSPNGGVVVMVCGNLLIDGEQQPQEFSQCFQLMPTEAAGLAPGSYFIFNDVFRLNIG